MPTLCPTSSPRLEKNVIHLKPDILKALGLQYSIGSIERAYEVPRSIIERWKKAAGITVQSKTRPMPNVGDPLHLMP